MTPWRHRVASAVAASAVLFSGQATAATATPVAASQDARQGLRAATNIAAQTYRQQRRAILNRYRQASRAAHEQLESAMLEVRTADQRQAALRAYREQTMDVRAEAHLAMLEARGQFRTAAQEARRQFGAEAQPSSLEVVGLVSESTRGFANQQHNL